MISPYTKYAAAMTRAADEAEALADDMRAARTRAPDAEGATADAIAAGFDNDIADLVAIAEAAREAARVANEQAPADAKFAAAPSKADVEAAQKAVTDAENSGADKQDIAKARNHAAALATEREDAKAEHAGVSRRTTAAFQAIKIADVPMVSVPTPVVAYGSDQRRDGAPGSPRSDSPNRSSPGSGSDTFSGGDSPSTRTGSASLADTDAGTSLSADGSGVPMSAQQLAAQPQQMQPQQGAMAGQPQMAPMAQTGAVPSAGAGRLTDPAALAKATAARNKKKDNNNGTPVQPTMAPMSFGGSASGGGTIDRGSSTSGVTTNANTSGSLKTALSGATVPPGTGQQPGMMARGGMGGMMGGAPGAGGAGGAGGSKERPTIYDANRPDEVERSDSIASGTLARDTALDPQVAEERERQK